MWCCCEQEPFPLVGGGAGVGVRRSQSRSRVDDVFGVLMTKRFALAHELLFFACAKKSNQKKAHPGGTPAASQQVRHRGGNFPKPPPAARKTAHLHVRRPCGVSPASLAVPQGPREAQQQRQLPASPALPFPFSIPGFPLPAA